MISTGELASLRRECERSMTVLGMCPRFMPDGSSDGCTGYSEPSPEFGIGNAALSVGETNFADPRIGQLCESVAFSFGSAFRMGVVTVQNAVIWPPSAFHISVGIVLGLGTEPEMCRIHAGGIIAARAIVKNTQPVWDIPHDETPGQAMGEPALIAQHEFPVRVDWTGVWPKPAGIGEVDFGPEGTDTIREHDELPFVVSGSGMLKHRRSHYLTIPTGIHP